MLNKRQLTPFLTTLLLTAVAAAYIFFLERRPFNLRLISKVSGDVSILLLGLVLLIGPLTRNFKLFDRWLLYRKNLGLWALTAALVHSYILLFPLSNNFPLKYFVPFSSAIYSGIVASILLIILGWFSFDKFIGKMNRKLWWKLQYRGVRLAALLAIAHVLLLKWPGWKFSEFFTKLPPFNFVISLFAALVLAVRLIDWLRSFRKP